MEPAGHVVMSGKAAVSVVIASKAGDLAVDRAHGLVREAVQAKLLVLEAAARRGPSR